MCRLFIVMSCSYESMKQQFSFVNKVSILQRKILSWQTMLRFLIVPCVIVTLV